MERFASDADCLTRSLQEPHAFEEIFDRHFDAVHRYLHRRAGRDAADELAAETFAVAFERRASCHASGSALPWLYGIATNLLRHRWRSERRELRAYGRSGTDGVVEHSDETAASGAGAFTQGAPLARALAAMRSRERDALLLYASATSRTRRSHLRSTHRSEPSGPGFTGRAGPHNASSRRIPASLS